MHTHSHTWRIPSAFWWVVAACLLAYSWQHLAAQTMPAAQQQSASAPASDLAGTLARIDQTANSAALDVAKLRIEKWKADSGDKQQLQANADSVERNLTAALPGMTTAVRNAPQDFAANFKLYRNMNALYDVMKTLTEASASFGSKQDYQTLAPYADSIDGYRRSLADYLEALSASKDAELARLRSQSRPGQAGNAQPKKVIIDDNAPASRKSAKKKTKPAPAPTNPQ